jgi:hypothetical protein
MLRLETLPIAFPNAHTRNAGGSCTRAGGKKEGGLLPLPAALPPNAIVNTK